MAQPVLAPVDQEVTEMIGPRAGTPFIGVLLVLSVLGGGCGESETRPGTERDGAIASGAGHIVLVGARHDRDLTPQQEFVLINAVFGLTDARGSVAVYTVGDDHLSEGASNEVEPVLRGFAVDNDVELSFDRWPGVGLFSPDADVLLIYPSDLNAGNLAERWADTLTRYVTDNGGVVVVLDGPFGGNGWQYFAKPGLLDVDEAELVDTSEDTQPCTLRPSAEDHPLLRGIASDEWSCSEPLMTYHIDNGTAVVEHAGAGVVFHRSFR